MTSGGDDSIADVTSGSVADFTIDQVYEFCAPKFFDFSTEETHQAIRTTELWFETSQSHAPSPFMPGIREDRSAKIESISDFGIIDHPMKEVEVPAGSSNQVIEYEVEKEMSMQEERRSEDLKAEKRKSSFSSIPCIKSCATEIACKEETSSVPCKDFVANTAVESSNKADDIQCGLSVLASSDSVSMPETACLHKAQDTEIVTSASATSYATIEIDIPIVQVNGEKGVPPRRSARNVKTNTKRNLVKRPSASKSKAKMRVQDAKISKQNNVVENGSDVNCVITTQIAQENHSIKRQKLDVGRSRKVLSVKTGVLPHKSSSGPAAPTSDVKGCHEEKKAHKEVTPFVSAAEMVNKFQSRTRDLSLDRFQNRSLPQVDTSSMILRRPKLTLTRPKEPELGTSQRVRAVRIKSFAELEEEMLAKIPKFKARPLNKKIFEAPTLPPLHRTAPQPPQFQEFHLRTSDRANQHAETSCAVSAKSNSTQGERGKLTEPKPPLLKTSLRARPSMMKSSQELELEELEKIPKFKARPLNKKIMESKGDIGLFLNHKAQVTATKEFHFATDDRLGPPAAAVDFLDKLSIHLESSNQEKNEISRITIPNPFHIHTGERGLEKERQLAEQISQKQLEEEMTRIPKANPYPYTTDYPVIPPKPEPKRCTKPEPFQLKSLLRHEEEMQRKLDDKQRMESEEAQRRIFRAQAIKRDAIPLPERERKPLTEVQEFALQVDHRAAKRSEFDKKIKEKELTYKRMREEEEHSMMVEEEKAVKQMRRTMVPHAKPLPKFEHPFHPQKSLKETTKPKSPGLKVNKRAEKRHVHLR